MKQAMKVMTVQQEKTQKKMNKILKTGIGFCLVVFFTHCVAQTKAVNSAEYALMSNTIEDLIIAKEEIDKAKLNPKTADAPKMWLIRATVYSRIAAAKNNLLLKGLTANAGLEASQAMNKFYASPISKKRDEIETAIGESGNAFAAAYNESSGLFSTKDYDLLCVYYVELLNLYGHLDTSMTNNLSNNKITHSSIIETYAQAASLHSDKQVKISILQGLVDKGMIIPAVIEGLYRSYLTVGDTINAETCIRKALLSSNNDGSIFQLLVNLYVILQRESMLFSDVNNQILIEPDNSRLYYTRAFLYESQKKYTEAIADYRKSVEIDEFNYDANFNLGLGLMKYESRNLYDKRSGTSGAKRKLIDEELKILFQEAKKYLERALDNTDYPIADQINICKTLKSACLEIGDAESVAKYTQLIKGMEEDSK